MASLTLLAVDTIYLTYDTYTTADALDYAEAPSTLAEKIADSSTYSTKVRSLTVGDNYSYTMNVNTIATTTGTLAASATASIGLTMIAGDNFPASGKALIGAEVISYATTTEVGSSTTALNTLVRGLSSTVDVSHSTSSGILPIVAGSVTSIDHNKEDDVFNISTSCTIPSAQFATIVENKLFTIPASEVAMVKYAA